MSKEFDEFMSSMSEIPTNHNDVREDDVEKLAEKFISNIGVFTSKTSGLQTYLKEDFKEGLIKFHKQMELKAKENTYTEEQVREAFMSGHSLCRCVTDNYEEALESANEFIQSLKQPKQ